MQTPRFRIRTMMVAVAVVAVEISLFLSLAELEPEFFGNGRYYLALIQLGVIHVVMFGEFYLKVWLVRRNRRLRRRPFRDTRRG